MTPEANAVRRGVVPAVVRTADVDPTSAPFWRAASEDRVVVQQCWNCQVFRFPPAALCPACRSQDVEWVEVPGTGSVYTFTVVRHPLHPGLASVVPYVAAVVDLDGTPGPGARMLGNLIDCDPDEVAIGDRVRVVFEHDADEESCVPRFVPA